SVVAGARGGTDAAGATPGQTSPEASYLIRSPRPRQWPGRSGPGGMRVADRFRLGVNGLRKLFRRRRIGRSRRVGRLRQLFYPPPLGRADRHDGEPRIADQDPVGEGLVALDA